jgi:predicted nucleic acid-binding protein
MILVDSDILVDFLLGRQPAADFLNRHRGETAISAITAFEILEGSRNKNDLTKHRRFIRAFHRIDIDIDITRKAFELFDRYFLSDNLRTTDALISATAVVKGLDFYSRNERHFKNIAELKWRRPY